MPTVLETKRLILREFVEDDAAAFHALNSNPEVTRYTDDGTRDEEHSRTILRDYPIADYHKHGFGRLACILKDDGRPIGFAGLKYLDPLSEVELGYRFLPEFWGRGLATEAARICLEYGFQTLGLTHIIALVKPENISSIRVVEKVGMTYVGLVTYHSNDVARYIINIENYRHTTG